MIVGSGNSTICTLVDNKVVAKSPESAVKLIVDRCNVVAGSERYTMDDFEAGSPIEPENFAKET